jgi:hypothetical protein
MSPQIRTEKEMFTDIAEAPLKSLIASSAFRAGLLSRIIAAFWVACWPNRDATPTPEFSDRQLADLNIRRIDVEQIDPRQMPLF